ncbi:MAG: hypothetical protein NC350_00295 [Corallococcus sp.]|nr:hypothetical protein [Corallococcus sp.]
MVKMLIKLDDAKIERIGKWDRDKMWDLIDDIFEEHFCSKEILEDSSRMYYGNPQREPKQLADIAFCYVYLRDQEWFAASVEKWIWYEPTRYSDTLSHALENYPNFAKAYAQ